MKNVSVLIFTLLLCASTAFGQKIQGHVYDTQTHEGLAGVNIFFKDKNVPIGTISDQDGFYELDARGGNLQVTFSYLGYETQNLPVVLTRNQTFELNVYMKIQSNIMDEIVVSVGRYEQKLSDITVSMDLLKASDLQRQIPNNLSDVLRKMPGIEISDKQPSIRGGSGWTYGIGSRTLILVDGMSALTPGMGEVNWNMIPTDNVDQVEIIKGASSVLYGSSALNGVINVRTARPGLDPKTDVSLYMGIYGNPVDEEAMWWSRDFWEEGKYPVEPFLRKTIFKGIRNPMYEGADFSHTRRVGNFDVSGSLNLLTDEGYRETEFNQRMRIGGNLTYHDPKIEGLNMGVNVNFMSNDMGTFYMWRSADEYYSISPVVETRRERNMLLLDPFINYTNPKNNTSHRLKGRIGYKSDTMKSYTTDKSLLTILDEMGFDYGSIDDLTTMASSLDVNALLASGLTELMSGNVSSVVESIKSVGNYIFPNATSANYMDLLSWLMGHSLPSDLTDTSSLIPWAVEALTESGKTETVTPADKVMSYSFDYQFSKKYTNARITAGAMLEHIKTQGGINVNTHYSDNIAAYFQYDNKFFNRLNWSAGVRFEYYRVDEHYREAETKVFGTEIPVRPVFRTGLNYQLADKSFLRASFGQGYRYPSITEKFVNSNAGGFTAYPNSSLKAEKGYNIEVGLKQGYEFGPFAGYFDAAGFYTQYKDMIEFQFGLYNTSTYDYIDAFADVLTMISEGQTPGLGVQFVNVSEARIYGLELSTNGVCKFTPDFRLGYNLGYTFLEPRDVDAAKRTAEEEANTDILAMRSKSNDSKYLKYRQKHTAKASLDLEYKNWTLGADLSWHSKTLAVDYFMVDEREKDGKNMMDYIRDLLFGDIRTSWMEENKGYFLMDLRAGIKITNNVTVQGQIGNLLNKKYSERPISPAAPRTFILRTSLSF